MILLYYFLMIKNKKKISVFRLILLVILFPLILIWAIYRKFKFRKRKHDDKVDVFNMSQIDNLSGIEFENILKEIFEKQKYIVSKTKMSHDYGADLILEKNKRLTIVQAKCYSKNIGIKAIQEIISAKKHYGADEMFVATNRYFSKDAIVLASEHNVRLIDRDVLIKLIHDYNPRIEVLGKKYVATIDSEKQKIEEKYKFWI